MTVEQYEAERKKIIATYGDSKQDAGVRWEQELAILFHRSGWTQEELAAQEGKSQRHVGRLLVFGRFLNLDPVGLTVEPVPKNLSERRLPTKRARSACGVYPSLT
jgi:DNA-binding transcriptional regulator LsrR (DeoR family)